MSSLRNRFKNFVNFNEAENALELTNAIARLISDVGNFNNVRDTSLVLLIDSNVLISNISSILDVTTVPFNFFALIELAFSGCFLSIRLKASMAKLIFFFLSYRLREKKYFPLI